MNQPRHADPRRRVDDPEAVEQLALIVARAGVEAVGVSRSSRPAEADGHGVVGRDDRAAGVQRPSREGSSRVEQLARRHLQVHVAVAAHTRS